MTGVRTVDKSGRRLKVGQVVRLSPGEAPVTVIRVTPGAAYVAAGDWVDGSGQPLDRDWTRLEGISPTAFVYPVTEGDL
jgi:hypothetical protein